MTSIENLAIIPARGGSKGIKKKNLRKINGLSLIEITVREILKSNIFDKVVLSSDSQEILEHGKSLEIELLKRPKTLALDNSPTEKVIIHVLKKYSKKNEIQNIGLFQPTSPLRDHKDIRNSFNEFRINKNSTLLSVCSVDRKYLKILYEDKKKIRSIKPNFPFMPRQSLPSAFLPNGAIYYSKVSHFLEHESFFSNNMGLFDMDTSKSLDIDSEDDLRLAKRLLKS